MRYFDDIEGVLSSEKDSLVQGESQILITTHDPMMVGSLKRELGGEPRAARQMMRRVADGDLTVHIDAPAGSLLATKFDDFMAGKREFTALFEPTDKSSLAGYTWTANHLVLNVLDDVKSRLSVLTPTDSGWKKSDFTGAPSWNFRPSRSVNV